MYPLLKALLQS